MTRLQARQFQYTYPDNGQPCSGRTVTAYRTVAPGIIITPYANTGTEWWTGHSKRWTLTHVTTGREVVGGRWRLTMRKARMVAGALHGLDIDWYGGLEIVPPIENLLHLTGMYNWLLY